MEKRYLVIGNWIDKSNGTPKSNIAPIGEGTSKIGNDYQITDTDNTTVIEGTYPVGTILQSTTTFATNTPNTPPPTADKAQATPPPKSTKA